MWVDRMFPLLPPTDPRLFSASVPPLLPLPLVTTSASHPAAFLSFLRGLRHVVFMNSPSLFLFPLFHNLTPSPQMHKAETQTRVSLRYLVLLLSCCCLSSPVMLYLFLNAIFQRAESERSSSCLVLSNGASTSGISSTTQHWATNPVSHGQVLMLENSLLSNM